MSRGFSGVLKLSDLDDFINPSQECIKPIEKPKEPLTQPLNHDPPTKGLSKIKVQMEDNGTYMQTSTTGESKVLNKVSVSLSDCLACSGCITSAESVLISQQGPDELIKLLEQNRNSKSSKMGEDPRLCVVSLGTQAVLSLAHKYNLSPQNAANHLAGFFRSLGADIVTTVTIGENFSLIESYKEFSKIYQDHHAGNKSLELPVLTGVCPGWVCYAEKLHHQSIPFISKVKSAQQIMGGLIKLLYGPRRGNSPDQITHVTLMSCFDRKLEGSRPDFQIEEYRTPEVDCVVTPVEIEQILVDRLGKTLDDFEKAPMTDLFGEPTELKLGATLMSHYGSGSGGYAEFVLREMAKELGASLPDQIIWSQGRNPDIWDYSINDFDGKVVLKIAIATGFRNIQTIVRKLKSKSLASQLPQYIEIMACPTGCMNGGAQLRSETEVLSSRDLSFKLENDYHNLPLESHDSVIPIYELLGSPDSKLYQNILYTSFHSIDKLPGLALGAKW